MISAASCRRFWASLAVLLTTAAPATAQTLAAAVLPTGRSVTVGATATAYATILNTGSVAGTSCAISPITSVAATFFYQTTDPATNLLTGAPNTPVNIPAGGSQTFAFGFTPTAAIAAQTINLSFKCANTSAAPIVSGLDTLTLAASTTPIADVIAVAVTPSGDGVARVHGVSGTGVISVAAVNIGFSGTAFVSAGASVATPVGVTLCETNPATGACFSAPSTGVWTTVAQNVVKTFSVFLAGQGTTITPDFANRRIRIFFSDPSGQPRGSTSVGICTGGASNCAAAPTITLAATPTTILPNTTAVLDWSTAGATNCTASGGWSGAKGTSGSTTTAQLAATTPFFLTCSGAGGNAFAGATVKVASPGVTLIANPSSAASGSRVQLSWVGDHVTGCAASGGWTGGKSVAGSEASPAITGSRTFTLTCVGPNGPLSSSAQIADIPLDNAPATAQYGYVELLPNRVLTIDDTGLIDLRYTDVAFSDRMEIVPFLATPGGGATGTAIPLASSDGKHWSVQLDASVLLRAYQVGAPSVYVGFLDSYVGGTRRLRISLNLSVRTAVMPDVGLQAVSSDMQTSPHVLNIRRDSNFGGLPRTAWPQLQSLVVSTIGAHDFYALLGPVDAFANRNSDGTVLEFPDAGGADLAQLATSHEIGHRWLAASQHPLVKGVGGCGHWAPGQSAYGIMGYDNPVFCEGLGFPFSLEDGATAGTTIFRQIAQPTEFNDLELYKMGLIPSTQVAPLRQFTSPAQVVPLLVSCTGVCTIPVPTTSVTIDQIIATDGPTAPATKTNFALAMVVISRNRLLNAREMAYFDWLAARGEGTAPVEDGVKPFTAATRGLMTLQTRIR